MHPFDRLAALCLWGARNFAHNLTFIPEERVRWQPSPGAPSSMEIAEHTAEFSRRCDALSREANGSPARTHSPRRKRRETHW